MIEAADILKNKTEIPWKDQFAILLKAYGQQLPAKCKLNNMEQISHENEARAEIRILDVYFTKT